MTTTQPQHGGTFSFGPRDAFPAERRRRPNKNISSCVEAATESLDENMGESAVSQNRAILNHPKLDYGYGLVLKPLAWGTPILGNPHMNTSHDQHWATYLRNLAERKWD